MFTNTISLAVKDFVYDRRLFFCLITALAAVLTPLQVLAGLKYGVVDALRQQLLQAPQIREIVNISNRQFNVAFIEKLRQRREVLFAIPRTRSLAATLNLSRLDSTRIITVDLLATAPGDPLLNKKNMPMQHYQIVLSTSVAEKLEMTVGDNVIGTVSRTINNRRESKAIYLQVVDISSAFPRDGAFITLGLLTELEDYRDGIDVLMSAEPDIGLSTGRSYAGFRLYARELEDVAPLSAWLRADNIDIINHSREIDFVLLVDRNLSIILFIVAVIGTAGCIISLGASLWNNIERKRRMLSILRLIGFSRWAMGTIPVIQSAFVACFALVIANSAFVIIAWTINRFFIRGMIGTDAICRLSYMHAALIGGVTIACALLSAMAASWSASYIEPAEGLADA